MTFTKDPDAVLDYTWDWSAWLAAGDTINEATFTVPDGMTLESSNTTDTTATVWLSGGTEGQVYTVTCQITTKAGRTDDRSAAFNVIAR